MTDHPETSIKKAPATTASGARKRVVWFVVVFLVCALTFLTAYQYAIPTGANNWYLFHVARHTSWMLDLVGHDSFVERPERIQEDPATVRAFIEAHKRGENLPDSVPASAEPAPPLTAWEAYQYRILHLPEGSNTGPFVSFILKPGLATRIEEATRRLQALEDNATLDDAARTQRRTELEAELEVLT